MGVVDFDPEKWREANEGAAQPAKPAKAANLEPIERPTLATLATLAGGAPPLPDDLVRGLRRLRDMPTPRLTSPDIWPEITADAERLAAGGWAQRALALGWEPLQLFGCSPAAGGLADLEGLAVWLAGRRIVLLDARSCVVVNGRCSRAVFSCRSMEGAVPLWELGRRGR